MATKKGTTKDADEGLVIGKLESAKKTIYLLGETPLILNRLSEKAARELLLPKKKANKSVQEATLKHDPLAEYQASVYRFEDDDAPTLLGFPNLGIKGALRSAALDLPGAKKSQVGRLIYVDPGFAPIFGTPQIFTAIARNKSMAGPGTPDPRTRAIVAKWATFITLEWATPFLNDESIFNLVVAAGRRIGIGDWRQEKGAGSFGCFRPVEPKDAELQSILKQGRAVQAKAMAQPTAYDVETEDLLSWFDVETKRRGFKVAA